MKYKLVLVFACGFFLLISGVYVVLNPEKYELADLDNKELDGSFVKLADGNTFYRFHGPEKGQLVVLVHGGTIPSWGWDEQINALSQEGFRVLSYDQFGRGYSDRPVIEYDQNLYQKQLNELLAKLDIRKPFHLIGLSLGGATVVNFTSQNPEKVEKLILISPVINNFKVVKIFKIPVIGEIMARFVGINVILKRFDGLYAGYPKLSIYKEKYIEQSRYKGFQQSLLSMLRSDALGDYTNAYKSVGNQIRHISLIYGIKDTEITKEMIANIHNQIPDIYTHALKNAGHGLLIQESEKVNELILNALSL